MAQSIVFGKRLSDFSKDAFDSLFISTHFTDLIKKKTQINANCISQIVNSSLSVNKVAHNAMQVHKAVDHSISFYPYNIPIVINSKK
jgi:hypothetical protein